MGERTPWEVFYACPSGSVDAFLTAAASLAPADLTADADGASALQTLSELAAATQVIACLTAAHAALGVHRPRAQPAASIRPCPDLGPDHGPAPRAGP